MFSWRCWCKEGDHLQHYAFNPHNFSAIGRNLREPKIAGQVFPIMSLKFKRSEKNIREIVSLLSSKKQAVMSKMFQEIKCYLSWSLENNLKSILFYDGLLLCGLQ